eukprot:scaffold39784_cov221-Amphora_coffeaeformis.AAC.1
MGMNSEATRIFRQAMPGKIARVIVCQAYEGEGRAYLLDFLTFKQARVVASNASHQPIVIAEDSVNGTLQELGKLNLVRDFIPTDIGGRLNCDEFFKTFIRERISVEAFVLFSTPSPLGAATGRHPALSDPVTKDEDRVIQKEGEKDSDFIKRRNKIYAQRSYHRRKINILFLEGEVKDSRNRYRVLVKENKRLKKLLRKAQSLVGEEDRKAQASLTVYQQQEPTMMPNSGIIISDDYMNHQEQDPPIMQPFETNEESIGYHLQIPTIIQDYSGRNGECIRCHHQEPTMIQYPGMNEGWINYQQQDPIMTQPSQSEMDESLANYCHTPTTMQHLGLHGEYVNMLASPHIE